SACFGCNLPMMSDYESPELIARRKAILSSPSYLLSEVDTAFLRREELRPVRFQLELLKPEMILDEQNIQSTVVVYGGTQIIPREDAERRLRSAELELKQSPDDPLLRRRVARLKSLLDKAHYYDAAREFGRIVSSTCQGEGRCDYVVV